MLLASISESSIKTTISTAEAFKSGLVAISTSNTLTMVMMPLATTYTSGKMVMSEWVRDT